MTASTTVGGTVETHGVSSTVFLLEWNLTLSRFSRKAKKHLALFSFHSVKSPEEAKSKWVDPQLRQIVEKVEEVTTSIMTGDGSTVASAVEDTITPTTGNSNGNRGA